MSLHSQFLISDVPRIHDTIERVYEDMRIITIVVTPLKLFYVAIHVLNAHLVKRPYDGTLKQAPYALNAVRVNIPYNPFLFRVIDGLVTGVVICNSDVGTKFVRVNGLGLILYSSFDKVMDSLFPDVWDTLDTDFPAPLNSTGNPCLVTFIAVTYIFFLSAYQRLIYFNHADKSRTFKWLIPHRLTDTMAEIPGGLVGNPESTLHLVSGDSFLGFTHEVDSDKPFTQRQVGIVHDSSAHNGELVSATSALPAIMLFKFQYLYTATSGTIYTVRPANALKCLTALVIGLKLVYQRNKVNHDSKAS